MGQYPRQRSCQPGELRGGGNGLDATAIATSYAYDAYGNRTSVQDPNGNTTAYEYGAVGTASSLYPTAISQAQGTTDEMVFTRTYDLSTGLLTSETDPNSALTSTTYDRFGRPWVKSAPGTSATFEYSDQSRRVVTKASKDAAGDNRLISVQRFDPLGRIRLTQKLESPEGSIRAMKRPGYEAPGSTISAQTEITNSCPLLTGTCPRIQWGGHGRSVI